MSSSLRLVRFAPRELVAAVSIAAVSLLFVPPTATAGKIAAAKKAKPAKPTATVPSVPSTTVVARKSLTVGTVSDLPGLDPALSAGDIMGLGLPSAMYDTLTTATAGRPWAPSLAESLTETDDRLSWTLRVRPNVTFHDGTPFDAAAVKFNLDRYRGARVTGLASSAIRSVEVVDPMTVRLAVARPFAALPTLLSGTIGVMLSPKAIQQKGDSLNRQPSGAGTGPYMFQEWVPNDRAVVVRNPSYWGPVKPRLEQITFKPIPDEQSRLAALLAGDIQSMITSRRDLADRAAAAGFVRVSSLAQGSPGLLFNIAKPPFDDLRMRRAAALAIDGDAIDELINSDSSKRGFGLWPTDNPWYSPIGNSPKYDRSAARLLANDYIKTTGRDAAFTILTVGGNQVLTDALRFEAKFLSDAGISVKIVEVADFSQLFGAIVTGQYEAAVSVFGLEKDPDSTAFPSLFSASPANFGRYKNPEMDAALEAGRTAPDLASRRAAYARVQEIFRRDVPFLLASPTSLVTISAKSVCGIDPADGLSWRTAGIGNC